MEGIEVAQFTNNNNNFDSIKKKMLYDGDDLFGTGIIV